MCAHIKIFSDEKLQAKDIKNEMIIVDGKEILLSNFYKITKFQEGVSGSEPPLETLLFYYS